MPQRETSWETRTTSPQRVAAGLHAALRRIERPAGAMVFVAGGLVEQVGDVAGAIAELKTGVPTVIAAGSAVLSDRGELQDISAATGVAWAGGRAEVIGLGSGGGDAVLDALIHLLADQTSRSAPTAFVFLPGASVDVESFRALREIRATPSLMGAGTVGDPGSAAVNGHGEVVLGPVVMLVRGLSRPGLGVTHACRLLADPRPITSCHGALVTEIAGQSALEVLATVGRTVSGKPLLFAVLLEEGQSEDESRRPPLLLRAVQGIDPERGGVYISSEVRPGLLLAYAVRDAAAARRDLEAMTREVARELAGGAPRFGVYLNCSGRGMELYGTTDIDTRLITERFQNLPLAGMQSAFEITPYRGRPALELYSGVLSVFASLS